MIHIDRMQALIQQFQNTRILVVGDVMLDHYVWGKVSRISPEAPVPVLDVMSESLKLGGAANVIHNVQALGATPFIASVIGDDANGATLKKRLEGLGVATDGLLVDAARQTTIKTRIISEYHRHHQQLARLDRECRDEIAQEVETQLITYIQQILPLLDGIILEDYGKGVVTGNLVQQIVALATRAGKIVAVDPKTDHFPRYQGVSVITPNHYEAGTALQMSIDTHDQLMWAGKKLLDILACKFVLITRGGDGMSLFEGERQMATHIPAVAQEVYDVAGAGDTVIAAFTISMAVGGTPVDAVILSNAAAGVVVGKMGIATISPGELHQALGEQEQPPFAFQQETLK